MTYSWLAREKTVPMKHGVGDRRMAQAREPKREDREGSGNTTAGWQDKKPHIAARSVDWKIWVFCRFAHIASHLREVRDGLLSSRFNADRTSRTFDHVDR